jgi:hypothetical protein
LVEGKWEGRKLVEVEWKEGEKREEGGRRRKKERGTVKICSHKESAESHSGSNGSNTG